MRWNSPHPGHQQAASLELYTTSCKHSLASLRMGEIIAQNMLSWLLIKLLLLHLVGCLYIYIYIYIYMLLWSRLGLIKRGPCYTLSLKTCDVYEGLLFNDCLWKISLRRDLSKFPDSECNCSVRFLSPKISVFEAKRLSDDSFKQDTALNSKHKIVGGLILGMFTLQLSCCAHLFDLAVIIKCCVSCFLLQL